MVRSTLLLMLDPGDALPEARDTSDMVYDEQLDNVDSILGDICEILADLPGVRFVVQGFSDEPWPVDVWLDLLSVLEQLSGVVAALEAHADFKIDFFEQGLERTLCFHEGSPGLLEVRCTSSVPTWSPEVDSLTIGRDELLQMLRKLARDVYELAERACPEIAHHRWVEQWIAAIRT